MTQPAEPTPQSIFQLTPQQVREVLRQAGREGWNTAGQVVAETTTKLDAYGDPKIVPTGKYTLSITDNQGNSQQIALAKGGPSMIQEPGQIGPPTPYNESWIVQEAPAELPKSTTSTQTMKGPNDTIYEKVNGVWTPVVPGDETKAATGRLELAAGQAKFDEMIRNQALGRGFITNKDAADLQLAMDRGELDRETLNFRREELARKNALEWETERRLGRTAEAEQGLTRARTGQVGVETAMNEEKLRQLVLAGPEAQRQAVLANQVTEAQLEAARQKMRQPTVQDLGQGPTYATMSPEGTITEQMRQGYVPKTQAEIAARVGQIQAAANAKEQEILQKYRDNPEQGLQEFNRWYDQNVQSQVGALQAAQEEAQFARAKDMAEAQRQAYQQASLAGSQAIQAYQAQAPRRVGPRAAEVLNQVTQSGTTKGVDWANAAFTPARDLGEVAAEATAKALKDISPMAAQMAGAQQPNYGTMNPAEVLNRTRWGLGGAPTAAAPAATAPAAAPAAAPATPGEWPPGATTPIIVNEAGQQQWGYPMQTGAAPALDTTGFGGAIGSNPMAAAMEAAQAQQAQQAAPPPAAVAAAPRVPAGPRLQRRMPAPAAVVPAPAPMPTGEAYYPTEVGGPVYMPPPYAPDYGLGTPMYPTEVGGPMSYGTPGFGFDPSNIQVAESYTPPQYQFPGLEGIYDAAQAAYQAVPRVRFGPGGWRRPY